MLQLLYVHSSFFFNSSEKNSQFDESLLEFVGYKLLFTGIQLDLKEWYYFYEQIPLDVRNNNVVIIHSKKVLEARLLDDVYNFFLLYKQAPNLGKYVMDFHVQKMRILGLKEFLKAYSFFFITFELVL